MFIAILPMGLCNATGATSLMDCAMLLMGCAIPKEGMVPVYRAMDGIDGLHKESCDFPKKEILMDDQGDIFLIEISKKGNFDGWSG